MTSQTSNLTNVEVTWDQHRIDAPLKGMFTMGFVNLIKDWTPSFGALPAEPDITTPEVIASEITSFAPEPYTLKSAMHIKIVGKGSEYIASHHESNIHASGDTPFEAIENLKSLILDTFDLLTSESSANLAIKAKHQRSLLEELIERL